MKHCFIPYSTTLRSARRAGCVLAGLMALMALAGCEKPADRARRMLEANNIAFTVDDFVDAAGRGDAETVRLFIEAGIDTSALDANGYTALMRAAEQGNVEVAQILIGAGTNLDAQGIEGITALMQAAQFNRLEMVRALIDAGADPRLVDEKGWSAMMKAIYRGHDRIVELMQPHAQGESAQALVLATVLGQRKVVETLLKGGASPDAAVEKGQTALMLAAARGNEEIALILLAAGAQALAADVEGKTASMIAAARGHRNLARLLQQAEAGKKITPPSEITALGSPSEEVPSPNPTESAAASASNAAPVADAASGAEPESGQLAASPESPTPPPPPADSQMSETSAPSVSEIFSADAPTKAEPSTAPQLKLVGFNQARIPFLFTAVRAGVGLFRSEDGAEYYARQGDPIGDGRFVVVALRERRIIDKDGSPVDASEARVKDTETGREHRLVKDLPSRASHDTAVLAAIGQGQEAKISVKVGEDFFIPGDPSTLYRLVDARPDVAVIRQLDTGETFDVTR